MYIILHVRDCHEELTREGSYHVHTNILKKCRHLRKKICSVLVLLLEDLLIILIFIGISSIALCIDSLNIEQVYQQLSIQEL